MAAITAKGRMQRVVIVGAGVIGLTTALHLLERFPGQLDMTIVSEEFSPHITSDKAGMVMLQVDFRTPEEKSKSTRNQDADIQRWTRATIQKYHSIYMSEENAKVEICMENGYILLSSPSPDPWYKDDVFGFRHVALDSVEASLLQVPADCVDIWAFGTYLVDMTSYLCWLTDKVTSGGVKLEQRRISSLEELSSYDMIINCTGLGSYELVGDKLMHPVRGQAILVEAPWVTQWLIHYPRDTQDLTYVLPRPRDIVLGGTAESGDWTETPRPDTAKKILKNCQHFFPSLCGAKVIGEWAGLRPLRDPVRLEACPGVGGANSLLVHCYGHGGQGIVLSWGCAMDIGDIVQHRLQAKPNL